MSKRKKFIVAVDGHSSCGKSTFAKQIAKKLQFTYIDSGAMYRAVACYVLENNMAVEKQIQTDALITALPSVHIRFETNQHGISETFLNGKSVEEAIRGVAVSELVSEVSKIKEVRKYLVSLQQEMGSEGGIVMDGRDIGTVVFPHAEVKLFMTADADVRARRRFDELTAKGLSVSYEEIRNNVVERDYHDMNRTESPLIQASDAVVLDNSFMTIEQQMEWFIHLLQQKKLL
ncbi:MAG: (d)CMP kinase [Bacteroidota bacterium]|nr:MAG: (d)CMP kinase [Bacteroidota bacterium]